MSDHFLRTPSEARQWLERHGVPVTAWARAHGFDPAVVFSLLSGRTRGRWGQAYEAAVALGLRSPPRQGEPDPIDAPCPHARRRVANEIEEMQEANMT